MTVLELLMAMAELAKNGKGDFVVNMRVGGDGAFHEDGVEHVVANLSDKQATLVGWSER